MSLLSLSFDTAFKLWLPHRPLPLLRCLLLCPASSRCVSPSFGYPAPQAKLISRHFFTPLFMVLGAIDSALGSIIALRHATRTFPLTVWFYPGTLLAAALTHWLDRFWRSGCVPPRQSDTAETTRSAVLPKSIPFLLKSLFCFSITDLLTAPAPFPLPVTACCLYPLQPHPLILPLLWSPFFFSLQPTCDPPPDCTANPSKCCCLLPSETPH